MTDATARTGPGLDLPDASHRNDQAEGDDIGVVELGSDQALTGTTTGRIADATTIMLLQRAELHGPFRAPGARTPESPGR